MTKKKALQLPIIDDVTRRYNSPALDEVHKYLWPFNYSHGVTINEHNVIVLEEMPHCDSTFEVHEHSQC
jgi:hypothetical protein